MEEGMSGFYIQPRVAERKGSSYGGATTTTGTGTKCGRWNPTAEQVKVLTDLFRAGLRTPSTEQIQKISTQLSFYGKIESKNVFYWFQNHKARERQKRRRVSKDDKDPLCCFQLQHLHKPALPTPSKWEINENQVGGGEGGREIETLELFPVKKESEKLSLWMLSRDECKENNNLAREIDYHLHQPPLDLRLSFF